MAAAKPEGWNRSPELVEALNPFHSEAAKLANPNQGLLWKAKGACHYQNLAEVTLAKKRRAKLASFDLRQVRPATQVLQEPCCPSAREASLSRFLEPGQHFHSAKEEDLNSQMRGHFRWAWEVNWNR